MKKAAVVLCGSGFKDGSEIREAVGVLWALSMEGWEAECFAPEEPQADVVNCLSGSIEAGATRSQLVESARIARGQVRPLARLEASAYQALVIPGGFGVAKSLCTFASKGSGGSVNPAMRQVLEAFKKANKPIGALCISPALLALAFPKAGLELTVGAKCEASDEIEKLGHRHVEKAASEWHVDRKNRIVTTPAYMFDAAPLREIFAGIHGLVRELKSLG